MTATAAFGPTFDLATAVDGVKERTRRIGAAARGAPRALGRAPRGPREALVFGAATVLALVHSLDDAFFDRGAGVPVSQHALTAVLALAIGVTMIAVFTKLRPGLRAGVALVFGALAGVNGAMHVMHVANDGVAVGDVSGVLAFGAGLTLIGLAVATPWRHRGTGSWRGRAVAIPATIVTLAYLIVPIGVAITQVHKWREPVGNAPSQAYQDVTFRSTDGLEIAGWYRPSRNGAAIVVVHGGGSDRKGAVAHATMLERQGYGVLLYDARGRGESEGSPNSYAWGWEKDAAGAVAFLKARPDVQPGRIGGLGLSSGADALVDVAATNPDLRAVVADGTALRTFEDAKRLNGRFDHETPMGWAMFEAIEVLSGDKPPKPLEDLVRQIDSPTLLISADRVLEYDFNVLYDKVAGPSVEHWNLPDSTHTQGLRTHRAEYERRVLAFFAKEL